MKKLIVIIIGASFFGCEEPKHNPDYAINSKEYMEVRIIDSCEYLSYKVGQENGFLIHKGNCKFCLKRKK